MLNCPQTCQVRFVVRRGRYDVDGGGNFKGRTLAGWYLQQFLKLGAAQYLPGLSKHFLIWDLDMILLQPLWPFYRASISRKMRVLSLKTVVNIGGARSRGYEIAYKRLTGGGDKVFSY